MVEIEKVCVDFGAGRGPSARAVDDASLRADAGEILGIVGTSGVGKSTLLCTLNVLTRPSQGGIKANGIEISALEGGHLHKARQHIGMVFRHLSLMHTHIMAQNVTLSLKVVGWEHSEISSRVSEILALVELSDEANRFPVQLSGGQKQHMGIACTIANHPDVLLCDESASALDLETLATILALLKQVDQQLGITIVLITHEMTMIKPIYDRVTVMSGDKMVESGEVFDVFAHPQHTFTQQLVLYTLNLILPKRLRQHLPGQLLEILFIGDSAERPVLPEIVVKFGVAVNILYGKIEYIGERALGILVAQLTASHNPPAAEVAAEYVR